MYFVQLRIAFIVVNLFMNGTAKLLGGGGGAAADQCPHSSMPMRWGFCRACRRPGWIALFCSIPDPWPQRRHRKRRFVSPATLTALARVVRPGGTFPFASDIDDYVGLDAGPGDRLVGLVLDRRAAGRLAAALFGLAGTRYEAKALRDGRMPSY
jgi:tRNA (guanine-N7-)-methyltransferase